MVHNMETIKTIGFVLLAATGLFLGLIGLFFGGIWAASIVDSFILQSHFIQTYWGYMLGWFACLVLILIVRSEMPLGGDY